MAIVHSLTSRVTAEREKEREKKKTDREEERESYTQSVSQSLSCAKGKNPSDFPALVYHLSTTVFAWLKNGTCWLLCLPHRFVYIFFCCVGSLASCQLTDST